MTTKIEGKYRRIDRRCPCGGNAQVCGFIKNGKEKRRWICDKCGTKWNKGQIQKFEKVIVK